MTPAVLELERAGCDHRVLEYDVDPAAGEYGREAAEKLGLPLAQVFKTLMAELADGELVVAVVPVDSRLDLKQLAAAASSKRASMAAPELAERRTGYVVGGISPFGQRRRHRTFVDGSADDHDEIYVSGGRRGLDIGVPPDALRDLLGASMAPLARRGA
jgi:Cys-tRNA(Pro)/Cys-tRNA(Cys) deacylase